jgi:voltage-gated potassium channel
MSSALSRIRIYILILASVLTISVIGFWLIERLSPLDALYVTVVTIATVGYGDITPQTAAGKLLVMFVILAGVGTFLFVFAQSVEIMVSRQESRARNRKINMVIGAFFSEAGVPLIKLLRTSVHDNDNLSKNLKISLDWSNQQFKEAEERLKTWNFEVDIHKADLIEVHQLLRKHRTFLVQLLQHPALFEHESFTDLLNAVFHLEEELSAREGIDLLPESDYAHLAGDTRRVIGLIIIQWIEYLRHMKVNYPYLFSLAVRTNPFDAKSSPIVQ